MTGLKFYFGLRKNEARVFLQKRHYVSDVRGSAGSVFRVPVLARPAPNVVVDKLKNAGVQIVVAESGADTDYLDADLRQPTALVLGGETGGIPDELRAAAAVRVRIPMHGGVESLNVAVTAGVLLFEARRQRR